MEVKSRLIELAQAAGSAAATEKQLDYIVALMARRELSVQLFKNQTKLTKQGASNYISSIPLMNKGLV